MSTLNAIQQYQVAFKLQKFTNQEAFNSQHVTQLKFVAGMQQIAQAIFLLLHLCVVGIQQSILTIGSKIDRFDFQMICHMVGRMGCAQRAREEGGERGRGCLGRIRKKNFNFCIIVAESVIYALYLIFICLIILIWCCFY